MEVAAAVILRHDHAGHVIGAVRRNQRRERRHVGGDPHIVLRRRVHDRAADRGVTHAVIGHLHLDARRAVGGRPRPAAALAAGGGGGAARRLHVRRMQAGAVGAVDLPLHHLRPVAGQVDAHDRNLGIRRGLPGRRLELRLEIGGAHINPHEAGGLVGGIRLVLHPVGEPAFLRLRRHLHRVAVHVEFPAVIKAAQPAGLVATEHQRRLAVWAELAEHTQPALGVAKRHQILAEQPQPDRRAVGLGELLGQRCRHPMATHHLPHRRVALDAAQQGVFLGGQHGRRSSILTEKITLTRLRIKPFPHA